MEMTTENGDGEEGPVTTRKGLEQWRNGVQAVSNKGSWAASVLASFYRHISGSKKQIGVVFSMGIREKD